MKNRYRSEEKVGKERVGVSVGPSGGGLGRRC